MTCQMEVLDASGHLTLTWDPHNPDETKKAREEFERLKAAGFAFFTEEGSDKPRLRIGKSGRLEGKLVNVREFNTEAPRTVAVRPMRGG